MSEVDMQSTDAIGQGSVLGERAASLRRIAPRDGGRVRKVSRSLGLAFGLLMFVVLGQRFGITIGRFPVSITLLVLPILFGGFLLRAVKLDLVACVIFLMLSMVQVVSFFASQNLFIKPTALFLTLALNSVFCFYAPLSPVDWGVYRRRAISFFTVISVLSILQFLIQFAIPGTQWFLASSIFPQQILVDQHFASVNPLSYGSTIYRSNGVFFPEPSNAGSFLSLGVPFSFWFGGSWVALGIQIVALCTTFSGLGFMTLGLFAVSAVVLTPRALGRRFKPAYLIAAACIGLVLAVSWTAVGIGDYGARRSSEFGSTRSSAYFRFVAPINQLKTSFSRATALETIIGRGSGAADELEAGAGIVLVPNNIVMNTYEYGIVGLILYFALILHAFRRTFSSPPLYITIVVQALIIQPMTNVAQTTMLVYVMGALAVAAVPSKKTS